MNEISERLHGNGRYATRTRERVVAVLRDERRYLTAHAVHDILVARGVSISLSTVYRTLELLVDLGVAATHPDESGQTAYVFCTVAHHHHAICRRCGRVEEVGCGPLERFARDLRTGQGFELEDHSIELYGRCAACASGR
ncbi:MAG TPA: Fur family transcriptional regulator, partial [Candidatus Dormibacteraeota bacterium]|nr:Fur family transcriptional regulator [Candidatus Dormibacteraeota bacterium]